METWKLGDFDKNSFNSNLVVLGNGRGYNRMSQIMNCRLLFNLKNSLRYNLYFC